MRVLLGVAFVLLAAGPVGVGVGIGLAVSAGAGVAAGCFLGCAVGVYLLNADLAPDTRREVSR